MNKYFGFLIIEALVEKYGGGKGFILYKNLMMNDFCEEAFSRNHFREG